MFERGDYFYGRECMLFVDIESDNDKLTIGITHNGVVIHERNLVPNTAHYSFHKYFYIGGIEKVCVFQIIIYITSCNLF